MLLLPLQRVPRLLLLLAASFKEQGKVKEAVVAYHRAYLFEVELAYAHYEMAQLYSQFGLEKECKEQLHMPHCFQMILNIS